MGHKHQKLFTCGLLLINLQIKRILIVKFQTAQIMIILLKMSIGKSVVNMPVLCWMVYLYT